jgi:hypothetical protein
VEGLHLRTQPAMIVLAQLRLNHQPMNQDPNFSAVHRGNSLLKVARTPSRAQVELMLNVKVVKLVLQTRLVAQKMPTPEEAGAVKVFWILLRWLMVFLHFASMERLCLETLGIGKVGVSSK